MYPCTAAARTLLALLALLGLARGAGAVGLGASSVSAMTQQELALLGSISLDRGDATAAAPPPARL